MSAEPRALAEFEYPSPELIECPYPFYDALRAQAPVHQLPSGEYFVSRWEDVVEAARNTAVFSNNVGAFKEELRRAYIEGNEAPGRPYTPWPSPFSDPPEHRRKRSFLLPLFSPARLRMAEPTIRATADELIDGFADRGEANFLREFADPFPSQVFFQLLGVPGEDVSEVRGWLTQDSDALLNDAAGEDATSTGSPLLHSATAGDGRAHARAYFEALIEERNHNPQGDLLTELVQAKASADDGELDLYYLAGEVSNLYAALTTVFMLASTMELLASDPQRCDHVARSPELIPTIVDESLRLEAPVQWLQRYVTQDTTLGGVRIPAGSIVLLSWASGNRDHARFEEPRCFRLDRSNLARDLLSFGHGAHRCAGAALARLEGRVAFEQLLSRLPRIRLAADAVSSHIGSTKYRSPRAVPIEFERHPSA
jgi:cytochrome P450